MPKDKSSSKPKRPAKKKAGGDCPSAPCAPRCEGYRRYGGAFTLGPVRWEQCHNTATVLLTIEQNGEILKDSPACAECWEEGRKAGIKQIEAKPILANVKDEPWR